jgi:hypothetical protein
MDAEQRASKITSKMLCGVNGLGLIAAPKIRRHVPNLAECVRHALDDLLELEALGLGPDHDTGLDLGSIARKIKGLLPASFDASSIPKEAESSARAALEAMGMAPQVPWDEIDLDEARGPRNSRPPLTADM